MTAQDVLNDAGVVWAQREDLTHAEAEAAEEMRKREALDAPADRPVDQAAEASKPAAESDGRAAQEPAQEPMPPPHNLPRAMQQVNEPWVNPTGVLPLRLRAVRIVGLNAMRPHFLAGLCRPYVDPFAAENVLAELRFGDRVLSPQPGAETNIRALLATATSLGMDLARLDVVKDIGAKLEPAKGASETPQEDVDIVLRCKPAGRFFLKSSTSLGNSEGTASIQAKLRNLFGGAESLEGTAALGTRTRHSYYGVFSTPVLASPDLWFNTSVLSQHRDMTSYASAHEGLTSVRSALIWTPAPTIRHELAYEASQRWLHHLVPEASVAIRKLAMPSLKSAISYTMEQDTRDDPLMATVGCLSSGKLEFAGLGGDTNFFKAEAQHVLPRAFGDGCAWSITARCGFLRMLDGRPACLSDRFMLGGPTCVRMFRLNTLGPKQQHDSLGGDAYWAAGLSVMAPIPWRPEWPLKLHSFLNAGQLTQLSPTKPLSLQSFNELTQPSASTGFGLLFQQGPVRLELNFGLPLFARRGDGARKGIQFGVGLSYL